MSYFQAKQRAEQSKAPDSTELLCAAFDCPMEWTVDKGTRLCTYHAWAESREWPSITEWLKSRQITGELPTFSNIGKRYPAAYRDPLTEEQKRETIKRLKSGAKSDPRAWAYKLRQLEEQGEKLSIIQKQMWRNAIGVA
jgi:hypothetical protein